jgi:hypothetical protein
MFLFANVTGWLVTREQTKQRRKKKDKYTPGEHASIKKIV